MKVGTIVKLKLACLGNKAGTRGVVFLDYGTGFQAIFENGNYDGFSEMINMPHDMSEAGLFLDYVGFCKELESYQFQNVIHTLIFIRKIKVSELENQTFVDHLALVPI